MPLDASIIMSPGFRPLASMIDTIGTVRCPECANTRSMSGFTRIWSSNTLPALVGSQSIAGLLMISTSGASLAITSSKPFWMSSV